MKFLKVVLTLLLPLFIMAVLSCSGDRKHDDQQWLVLKCGRCHKHDGLQVLFAKAKAMSKEEFESALDGMAHEGIDFTDEEKSGASRIIDVLRQEPD